MGRNGGKEDLEGGRNDLAWNEANEGGKREGIRRAETWPQALLIKGNKERIGMCLALSLPLLANSAKG